jgi:divalent metal cation (Fe/Co/Zn/Cd) transporter
LAKLSATAEALAEDHRNDVVSNALGIVSLLIAKFAWPYADPLMGVLVSLFIMYSWATKGYEQLMAMNGSSAPPEVLNQITYAALTHHEAADVDTVRATSSGGGYLAEIDIVLPAETRLDKAHNIGESLQLLVENSELFPIARCFVHLDYETAHNPWHHR